MNLSTLPKDIFFVILDALGFADMFRLLRTCKRIDKDHRDTVWVFMKHYEFPTSVIEDEAKFRRAVKAHRFYTEFIYTQHMDYTILQHKNIQKMYEKEKHIKWLSDGLALMTPNTVNYPYNRIVQSREIASVREDVRKMYEKLHTSAREHIDTFKDQSSKTASLYVYKKLNMRLYTDKDLDEEETEYYRKWLTRYYFPDCYGETFYTEETTTLTKHYMPEPLIQYL